MISRKVSKGIELSRADVEWLLAAQDGGLGPIDWNDESQRERKGLDLRGAILRHVDLSKLPLAGLQAGLGRYNGMLATSERRETAAIHLQEANLTETHLEGADLSHGYLESADFMKAYLNNAILIDAHLKNADLTDADLEKSILAGADLEMAKLIRANLRGAELTESHLEHAIAWHANLEGANFWKANMDRVDLSWTNLTTANFLQAQLKGTELSNSRLEGAKLFEAHLEGASLFEAHLEGAELTKAHLEGASLVGAYLDSATQLSGVILGNAMYGYISLADVHWGDAHLTVLNWSSILILGDEPTVRPQKGRAGIAKDKNRWLDEWQVAVRANRQLAVALQNQGLNEEAARFAHRAQVLQRKVLWKQRDAGKWLFSMLLALLAGYGYRIWHILAAYLVVVSVCAVAYFVLGLSFTPHLSLLQAYLESIIAFHGRVFAELFLPNTPQIWVTAFEAVAGLVIEGVFIAMLTQRFFGK